MSNPLRLPTGLAAAAALLMAGVLSSCGVAGTGFHPGVAAEVGDDQVKLSTVDTIARDYCSAIKEQLSGQALPNRYLRGGVVGQLALVSAARQLAAEYDVEPGVQYEQKVAELRAAVATLDEGAQDAVVTIESAGTYLSSVATAVGTQLLTDAGESDPGASEARAAGEQALVTWLDENDVQIDPRFGVRIEQGAVVPADGSVSTAVGDTARAGIVDSPDPEYAASLPASLRCG